RGGCRRRGPLFLGIGCRQCLFGLQSREPAGALQRGKQPWRNRKPVSSVVVRFARDAQGGYFRGSPDGAAAATMSCSARGTELLRFRFFFFFFSVEPAAADGAAGGTGECSRPAGCATASAELKRQSFRGRVSGCRCSRWRRWDSRSHRRKEI